MARKRKPNILTRDALVLLHIAMNPESTLREIAHATDITERAVQPILGTLRDHGMVSWEKDGRKKRYAVHVGVVMDSPAGPFSVGQLVDQLGELRRRRSAEPARAPRPARDGTRRGRGVSEVAPRDQAEQGRRSGDL